MFAQQSATRRSQGRTTCGPDTTSSIDYQLTTTVNVHNKNNGSSKIWKSIRNDEESLSEMPVSEMCCFLIFLRLLHLALNFRGEAKGSHPDCGAKSECPHSAPGRLPT